jgi:hypothetical protein
MAKTRKSPARRNGLMLTAKQTATLTELATLAYYGDGFTYTDDMMALSKYIADLSGPIARRECLHHSAIRERAIVRR